MPNSKRLDSLIDFEGGVDAAFYGKLLSLATRHFKANDATISIPAMNATRRCAALIEAIITGKIEVES